MLFPENEMLFPWLTRCDISRGRSYVTMANDIYLDRERNAATLFNGMRVKLKLRLKCCNEK